MDIKDRCDIIRREGDRLSSSDLSLNVGYYSLFTYKYKNQCYIMEMLNGDYINLQPILNNYNDWK